MAGRREILLQVHLFFNSTKPTQTNDQHLATGCHPENGCCVLIGTEKGAAWERNGLCQDECQVKSHLQQRRSSWNFYTSSFPSLLTVKKTPNYSNFYFKIGNKNLRFWCRWRVKEVVKMSMTRILKIKYTSDSSQKQKSRVGTILCSHL